MRGNRTKGYLLLKYWEIDLWIARLGSDDPAKRPPNRRGRTQSGGFASSFPHRSDEVSRSWEAVLRAVLLACTNEEMSLALVWGCQLWPLLGSILLLADRRRNFGLRCSEVCHGTDWT
jgi:hypothetical protein